MAPNVLVISEIPTPYRLPFYELLGRRPELELEVVFLAETEPDRPWELADALAGVPHRVLRGYAPRVRTRRNTFVYELNPGIVRVLRERRWDAVVVGGYAVLAEQLAVAWAQARRVPYLLHSESHLGKARRGWVRAVKRGVLPLVVGRAAAGLAVGSAAARYLEAYGLPQERIRIVPNTIDVARYAEAADRARARRDAIGAERGLPDRFVLFAGRLVEAKGVADLLAALERLGAAAPPLVVAGEGPLESTLRGRPGVHLTGFLPADDLIELYSLAAATIVPSRDEPWGVVVNEALACGCPVIASDAVGAAEDLIRDGVDGRIFAAGDVDGLAAALAAPDPPGDPRSGRIARWTYDFAVEQFLEALAIAVRSGRG